MDKLKPSIHDEANGLDYVLVGDYYIPAIELSEDDDRIKLKMEDAGVLNMSVYVRKMALDGICIRLDLKDVRQLTVMLRQSKPVRETGKRNREHLCCGH